MASRIGNIRFAQAASEHRVSCCGKNSNQVLATGRSSPRFFMIILEVSVRKDQWNISCPLGARCSCGAFELRGLVRRGESLR